jgi:arylsulfatase A-like enzyme
MSTPTEPAGPGLRRRDFLRTGASGALFGAFRASAGGAAQPHNVVFIVADQLRADALGCYGNPICRTPNIDRLAAEGVRFANAFSQHPQCVPSRSAMLTGRYPHENGATSNYTAMSSGEQTIPEVLRAQGLQTAACGKLHIFDEKEKAAFEETHLSGGQRSGATDAEILHDDYKRWAKENGYWDDLQRAYQKRAEPQYQRNFQAHVSPMPAEAYVDSWVAHEAIQFLQRRAQASERRRGFFLFVGFPNPHNPFEPPEPYASMYDPADMPIPESFREDLSTKPPRQLAYKRYGRKPYDYESLDEDALRRVIAYYYASVTLVDDQVGKIVETLAEANELDGTLVVFTSDHGEFLGNHGLLQKSIDEYPMLYDDLLHVPLVLRDRKAPRVVDELVELIDLCPTVLEWAGREPPAEVQGRSLAGVLEGNAPPKRDYVFAESGAVKMLRGKRYKLIYYPRRSYGELYDLENDPGEITNLYDSAQHRPIRDEMTRRLLDRLIHTEGPRHGQSLRGPAYWRKQYRAPFPEGDTNTP